MKQPRWTSEQVTIAEALIARNATDEECLAEVGRSRHCCYVKVSRWPEQKARGAGKRKFRKPRANPCVQVPPAALVEAERRLKAPRSLTAWLCGGEVIMGPCPPVKGAPGVAKAAAQLPGAFP